jgi:hypothetical protein
MQASRYGASMRLGTFVVLSLLLWASMPSPSPAAARVEWYVELHLTVNHTAAQASAVASRLSHDKAVLGYLVRDLPAAGRLGQCRDSCQVSTPSVYRTTCVGPT